MDNFTILPDVLLITIISLLPFIDAARTSTVSKKLRYLWRGTTNIVFNENFFVKSENSIQEKTEQRRKFLAFSHGWIENYPKQKIESFHLVFSAPTDFRSDMEHFILFATSHHVKYLTLNFYGPAILEANQKFNLPMQVFQNQHLEFLKLFSCTFQVPKNSNIPLVKHITLGIMELNSHSIKSLLWICPRLEVLHLNNCLNIDVLDVSVPSCRNLELRELDIDSCAIDQMLMRIKAPKLRILKYNGDRNVFDFDGSHQEMISVDLDYGMVDEFENDLGDLFHMSLQNIPSIRVLTVCSYLLQVLPTGMEAQCEPPLNVKKLSLNTRLHENDFLGITYLLKSCPNLETLIINLAPRRIYREYESPWPIKPRSYWIKDLNQIVCVVRTLKVLKIVGFKGTYNELQFIHYMLKFGRVMERLLITVAEDSNIQNVQTLRTNAEKVVRSCERASHVLQVWIE